jgi:hypothetical protein
MLKIKFKFKNKSKIFQDNKFTFELKLNFKHAACLDTLDFTLAYTWKKQKK